MRFGHRIVVTLNRPRTTWFCRHPLRDHDGNDDHVEWDGQRRRSGGGHGQCQSPCVDRTALPPENATGNFVKIVQRVPVKILIDDFDDIPGNLVICPL
jgi:hypothetical protein